MFYPVRVTEIMRTNDPCGSPDFSGGIPSTVDDVDWQRWSFTEDAVLCFVHHGDKVLLIHKKTGLGAGKVNAPGGRIDSGETAMAAAVRETQEETHITPAGLEQVGELQFIFTDGYSLRGHVFFARRHEGCARATPEADPFWCELESIPYDQMWADDAYWLPRVLAGERLLGRFIFDGDRMMSLQVIPHPCLPTAW